jgi:tetratricopeptide (TPR) repeat protein
MTDLRAILESERKVEREFVASDRANPKGWSVALTMFHFVKWRERILDALSALRDGRTFTPPPQNVDEFNDAELADPSQMSLVNLAGQADSLLASLIDVYEAVGDRPFSWYRWPTTTEALLGSAYIHPHTHIVEYLKENDDLDGAVRLMESTVSVLRRASAPSTILGVEIYNLGCLRVAEGRYDEALRLIEESVALRPNLKDFAPIDPDLTALYDDQRFRAIVN